MIRRKCESSSIPTSAKPRWGGWNSTPRGRILTWGRGSARWGGGLNPQPPGNSNTDYILYILYAVACSASSCKLRHCQLLWSGAPLSSSGLKEALYKYPDWMNEWMSFSPLSVVDVIMGGACFYVWTHVCMHVCISLYTYVGVHACMCVRPANDFINVKTETK